MVLVEEILDETVFFAVQKRVDHKRIIHFVRDVEFFETLADQRNLSFSKDRPTRCGLVFRHMIQPEVCLDRIEAVRSFNIEDEEIPGLHEKPRKTHKVPVPPEDFSLNVMP